MRVDPDTHAWLLDGMRRLIGRVGMGALHVKESPSSRFDPQTRGLKVALKNACRSLGATFDVEVRTQTSSSDGEARLRPLGVNSSSVVFGVTSGCEGDLQTIDVVRAVVAWFRSEQDLVVQDRLEESKRIDLTAVLFGFGLAVLEDAVDEPRKGRLTRGEAAHVLAARIIGRRAGFFGMWWTWFRLARPNRVAMIASVRALIRPYGRLAWELRVAGGERFGPRGRLEVGQDGVDEPRPPFEGGDAWPARPTRRGSEDDDRV